VPKETSHPTLLLKVGVKSIDLGEAALKCGGGHRKRPFFRDGGTLDFGFLAMDA
jgi:hypothetical protein